MDDIKKQAIAHYDRMIEWAKKQNPDKEQFASDMREELNETYDARSCSYCIANKFDCELCKLSGINIGICCNGLFFKMCLALTWGEWIERAKEVKKYIEING